MINLLEFRYLLLSLSAFLIVSLAGSLQETKSSDQQKTDTKLEEDFPTPLLQAIFLNSPKTVASLLSEGASPQGADHDNFTKIPLLLATERRNVRIVKLLLDAGADKESRERLGLTAIHLAVMNQHLEMVQYLIMRGADVNSKGDSGSTALMSAAQLGTIPIMKELIEAGG